MAIDLNTTTVEIKEQDRTYEAVIHTPANGKYELHIYRHVIDKNTKGERSREAKPYVMTRAEMMTDPDIAPMLASLPAILDRIVLSKRPA